MAADPFQGIIDALNGPIITDWIAAVGTCLTFAVALIALLYAKRQVDEAKRAREQTQDLERERSQPNVVVFTEPSVATVIVIEIVIKNFGATAARDVRVSLDPWPTRSVGKEWERVEMPEVIPILAPGQEWRTMWDSGMTRSELNLPDRHDGSVTFKGIGGEELASPVVLDFGIYRSRMWTSVLGVHDLAQSVRDLRHTVKRSDERFGERGLRVFVRDGAELDRKIVSRRRQFLGSDAADEQPENEEATGDVDETAAD